METLITLNKIVTVLFVICYGYQLLYIPLSLWKRKQVLKPQPMVNRYAVLICARNERTVIADLIDCLKHQSYPQQLLDIYVMADNCTDDTADIAREHGATVFERHNQIEVGKGFALNALLQRIWEHDRSYDGYFVFDADNILPENYIEMMNNKFMEGNDIVTSYRNSKNFFSSWIAAGHAVWFLRESIYVNFPRSLLGLSCGVSGTGFMFSKKIAEELKGWPFHCLTEDVEFTVHEVCKGRRVAFCKEAQIYDEQPISLKESVNQRLRWSRGSLQVIEKYFRKLLMGSLDGNLSCLDMLVNLSSAIILCIISVFLNVLIIIGQLIETGSLLNTLNSLLEMFAAGYLTFFIIGLVVTVSERKRIIASKARLILYTFTFPLYVMTNVPITVASVLVPVSWKPIRHSCSLSRLKFKIPQ